MNQMKSEIHSPKKEENRQYPLFNIVNHMDTYNVLQYKYTNSISATLLF